MATSVDFSALTSAIDVTSVNGHLVAVAGTLIGISVTLLIVRKVFGLVRRG